MRSCTLSQFSIETTGIGLSGRTVRLCLGFPGSRYSSVRTDGRVSDVCTGAVGRETASCGMVALSVYGSDCGLVGVFSFAGVEVIAPHDRVLTGLDAENAGQRNYTDRNLIEKWFQTLKMRIDRFHNSWIGSRSSFAAGVCNSYIIITGSDRINH